MWCSRWRRKRKQNKKADICRQGLFHRLRRVRREVVDTVNWYSCSLIQLLIAFHQSDRTIYHVQISAAILSALHPLVHTSVERWGVWIWPSHGNKPSCLFETHGFYPLWGFQTKKGWVANRNALGCFSLWSNISTTSEKWKKAVSGFLVVYIYTLMELVLPSKCVQMQKAVFLFPHSPLQDH